MSRFYLVVLLLAASLFGLSLLSKDPAGAAARVLQVEFEDGNASCMPVGCRHMIDGSYIVTALTAKHVAVYGNGRIRLGDDLIPWLNTQECETDDIAIIRFRSPRPVPFVRLAEHSPSIGAPVWKGGYGRHEFWESYGLFSGGSRATCAIAPGDSGGGVVDSDGRLIGIVSMISQLEDPPQLLVQCCTMATIEANREWLASRL